MDCPQIHPKVRKCPTGIPGRRMTVYCTFSPYGHFLSYNHVLRCRFLTFLTKRSSFHFQIVFKSTLDLLGKLLTALSCGIIARNVQGNGVREKKLRSVRVCDCLLKHTPLLPSKPINSRISVIDLLMLSFKGVLDL